MFTRWASTQTKRKSFVFVVILVLTGCWPDTTPIEPDYEAEAKRVIDRACRHSRAADYDAVEVAMNELSTIPGADGQAAYGSVLLAGARALNEFADIVSLAQRFIGVGFRELASTGLDDAIHRILEDLRNSAVNFTKHAEEVVANYPDDKIIIDQCAFYFDSIPVLVLSGEIDQADVHMTLAISNIIAYALDMLLAQTTGMNVPDVLKIGSQFSTVNPNCLPHVFSDKRCLLQVLAWMLNEYPDLLKSSENGKQWYQTSVDDFVKAIDAVINIRGALLIEYEDKSDSQNDELFAITKVSSIGGEEQLEITMQNYGMPALLSGDWLSGALTDGRTVVFREPAQSSIVFNTDGGMYEAITRVRNHLTTGEGYLDVQDVVLPFVQLITPFILGVFADEIGELLDGTDPSGSLREGFSVTGWNLNDIVELLVQEILPPEFIYLDVYGFVQAPVDFREILPVYDGYMTPGEEVPMLAFEWECEFNHTDAGVCPSKLAPPVDAPHFVGLITDGTDYEMAADGIAEQAPYIAFQDPTLGGYLYVDVSAAPQTTDPPQTLPPDPTRMGVVPEGPVNPTNYELNYALHRIVAYVQSTIEAVVE